MVLRPRSVVWSPNWQESRYGTKVLERVALRTWLVISFFLDHFVEYLSFVLSWLLFQVINGKVFSKACRSRNVKLSGKLFIPDWYRYGSQWSLALFAMRLLKRVRAQLSWKTIEKDIYQTIPSNWSKWSVAKCSPNCPMKWMVKTDSWRIVILDNSPRSDHWQSVFK